MSNIEVTKQGIARLILDKDALIDYRRMNDCPFEGILIPCVWSAKENIKETIREALRLYIRDEK